MDKEYINILEQENSSLRECIGSVLVRLADYDGYNNVKGLKYLIDGVVETLHSGYPERIVDYKEREVCPLCYKVLKNKDEK